MPVSHNCCCVWRRFSTSKSPDDLKLQANKNEKPIGLKDKLKLMWNKYGIIAIGSYGSIYILTFISVYVALDNDLINFDGINSFLYSQGLEVTIDPVEAVQNVIDSMENLTGNSLLREFIDVDRRVRSQFLLALTITSFTDFIRIPISLFIIPKVARAMGKK